MIVLKVGIEVVFNKVKYPLTDLQPKHSLLLAISTAYSHLQNNMYFLKLKLRFTAGLG